MSLLHLFFFVLFLELVQIPRLAKSIFLLFRFNNKNKVEHSFSHMGLKITSHVRYPVLFKTSRVVPLTFTPVELTWYKLELILNRHFFHGASNFCSQAGMVTFYKVERRIGRGQNGTMAFSVMRIAKVLFYFKAGFRGRAVLRRFPLCWLFKWIGMPHTYCTNSQSSTPI